MTASVSNSARDLETRLVCGAVSVFGRNDTMSGQKEGPAAPTGSRAVTCQPRRPSPWPIVRQRTARPPITLCRRDGAAVSPPARSVRAHGQRGIDRRDRNPYQWAAPGRLADAGLSGGDGQTVGSRVGEVLLRRALCRSRRGPNPRRGEPRDPRASSEGVVRAARLGKPWPEVLGARLDGGLDPHSWRT